jgi:hypothetical protein
VLLPQAATTSGALEGSSGSLCILERLLVTIAVVLPTALSAAVCLPLDGVECRVIGVVPLASPSRGASALCRSKLGGLFSASIDFVLLDLLAELDLAFYKLTVQLFQTRQ